MVSQEMINETKKHNPALSIYSERKTTGFIPWMKRILSEVQKSTDFKPWISILFCSFFLFYPSFFYYFFQDDWFVLNWVNSGNWLSFFEFRTDIIYWRPLTMPVFFALGNRVFNLNPVGFHLLVFTFHIINSILVYLLFKQLKLSALASKFSAFCYAVSAFHFIGLSWISTNSYIIGTTFILISIITFLKLNYISSFFFFLLALSSSEMAVIIIPLLLIVNKNFKSTFKYLLPNIIVLVFYFAIRLLIFPIPSQGDYGLSFGTKTLINIFWYFLWTFNIAEKFSTIFFLSDIKNFPTLIVSHFNSLILPIIIVVSSAVLTLISRIKLKDILLGISWFIISLSPVIVIPKHVYPIYLVIASLGIFYILAKALDSTRSKKLLIVIFISSTWFLSSYFTLDFTRKTHWIANQQAISQSYTKYLKDKVKSPSDNSIFIIKPADLNFSQKFNFTLVETEQNVKQSLNNQDGVRVIYKNQTLNSIFATHQESVKTPNNVEIYEIAPRIE